MWFLFSFLLIQVPILGTGGGVITGVVRYPDGLPAVGIRVAAMAVPEQGVDFAGSSTPVSISQSDEFGRYRLENVPAGRYYIVAGRLDEPTYYPGVAATSVSVSDDPSIEGTDFVIPSPKTRQETSYLDVGRAGETRVRVCGSSIAAFAGPPTQISVRIVADGNSKNAPLPEKIALDVQSTGNAIPHGATVRRVPSYTRVEPVIAADGTFTISLRTGDSTIALRDLPGGYTVKAMASGATDLMKQPLRVLPSGNPEIVIVLSAP
jgi:hypothetical protein